MSNVEMRKSIVSLMVMLVASAALVSNLVHAYVLIPGPDVYVSPSTPEGGLTVTVISGVVFYDANVNGVRDDGEAGIEGCQLRLYKHLNDVWTSLSPPTETDSEGHYTFFAGEGDYRVVVEVVPSEAWVQTAPSGGYCETNAILGDHIGDNNFGIVYLTLGYGGKTIGFWGSKNGQSLITYSDVTALNRLNLYTPNGWNYPKFDTTDLAKAKTQIKNYLRNATAVDMCWMLSAQLIATKLNVLHGFLSNETRVYIESSRTFITIGKIMENAYEALQGADRDAQEYWKNLLDWVNNNWLRFVIPNPP